MYKLYTSTDVNFVIVQMTILCYTVYMYETLLNIGLSEKEAEIYLLLLKAPDQTAQSLANQTGIKRPNVYRILDILSDLDLITANNTTVKTFRCNNPENLQKLVHNRQLELKQTARSLAIAMPDFRSQHALSTNKPGVSHMAGDEGFLRLLESMTHSRTEVLLIASNDLPNDPKTLEQFRQLLLERRDKGIATRALFHDGPHRQKISCEFAERGIEVKFIGETPFKGEVALYDNSTAFTVYDPSLVVTVITNQHITDTMRQTFEGLWKVAKS